MPITNYPIHTPSSANSEGKFANPIAGLPFGGTGKYMPFFRQYYLPNNLLFMGRHLVPQPGPLNCPSPPPYDIPKY